MRVNHGGWRYSFKRWMYRGDRPHRLARLMIRLDAMVQAKGLVLPDRLATLEVRGRRSGRLISVPVVVADHAGSRYLVAMLGENANWVHNVRAAGGRAVLRHGFDEAVQLHEIDPSARAVVVRRYLAVAPGARPHIPVGRKAPLAEFERIAPHIPVFRIDPAGLNDGAATGRAL